MASASPEQEKLFDFQRALLAQEMEYIHGQIAHFDTLSFQIKGWAVTLWGAIIAFGSSQTTALVVLASIPAMLTFWILDALFKQYQRRFIVRMAVIEMFLDSRDHFQDAGLRQAFDRQDFGDFPLHDPIASRTRRLSPVFDAWYRSSTGYWRMFLVINVLSFYTLLIMSSLVIALMLL